MRILVTNDDGIDAPGPILSAFRSRECAAVSTAMTRAVAPTIGSAATSRPPSRATTRTFSVTPLHLDLTAYQQMERVRDWALEL